MSRPNRGAKQRRKQKQLNARNNTPKQAQHRGAKPARTLALRESAHRK